MAKLPSTLLDSLDEIEGFAREAFQAVHQSGEQVTSIRFNPKKWPVAGDASLVSLRTPEVPAISPVRPGHPGGQFPNFPISQSIPWSSHGYYLNERPSFTLDPLFHAGCYYVQEASSMFLEQALKQTVDLSQPVKVLDLCAAPGGKSTLIQSFITSDSLLVSNEVIKSRVNVLQENLIKWGGANVVLTNNDAKDFASLYDYFDLLVVDAPCSGSGLFRKDPEAIGEWSENNVKLCSQRQQRILADAFSSLKKNGIVIYCTCSYSTEENEEILDWMAEKFKVESLRLTIKKEWNIVETQSMHHNLFGYRFYPDKLKGEGFFIACLQKKEGEENFNNYKRVKTVSLSKNELSIVKEWVKPDAGISFMKHGEEVIALPSSTAKELPFIQNNLYIRQVGIKIGKLTTKELIPDHALALSGLANERIASVSLNKETALQYLRKADVLTAGGQKGWVLVKYDGCNLGWIKDLGNRINNYYPKDWRILKR